MHCKSLWIKASAKCIIVNVNILIGRDGEHEKTEKTHAKMSDSVCNDFNLDVSFLIYIS